MNYPKVWPGSSFSRPRKRRPQKQRPHLWFWTKKRKTTEIEKPASHLQTWHTFSTGQENEKNVIKNGGYACSFLWYGGKKYIILSLLPMVVHPSSGQRGNILNAACDTTKSMISFYCLFTYKQDKHLWKPSWLFFSPK